MKYVHLLFVVLFCLLLAEISPAFKLFQGEDIPMHITYDGRFMLPETDVFEYNTRSSEMLDDLRGIEDYMDMDLDNKADTFKGSAKSIGHHDVSHATKRAFLNQISMAKRIHTCAFMRRLGLPIGLCFKGTTVNIGKQPEKTQQPPKENVEKNVYAYLERNWPVHSFLGGSVGR